MKNNSEQEKRLAIYRRKLESFEDQEFQEYENSTTNSMKDAESSVDPELEQLPLDNDEEEKQCNGCFSLKIKCLEARKENSILERQVRRLDKRVETLNFENYENESNIEVEREMFENKNKVFMEQKQQMDAELKKLQDETIFRGSTDFRRSNGPKEKVVLNQSFSLDSCSDSGLTRSSSVLSGVSTGWFCEKCHEIL